MFASEQQHDNQWLTYAPLLVEGTHSLSSRDPIEVQVWFKIEKRLKSSLPLSPCPSADASWNLVGEGNTPIAFDAAAS